MTTETYRTRIYTHYVQAREQVLAPETLAGLAPRAHALRQLVRRHFPADKNAAVLCSFGRDSVTAGYSRCTNGMAQFANN